jgi:hypothetical protein
MQQCVDPSRNGLPCSARFGYPLHRTIHVADSAGSHAIPIEKGDTKFAGASRVKAEIDAFVISWH